MFYLYVLRAVFIQHWHDIVRFSEFLFITFQQLGTVAGLAWLAGRSKDPTVVSMVAVGVVFMVLWRAAVFQLGRLIAIANIQGTLELEMMAPSPIALIVLGKALAAATFYGAIGIGAFILAVVIGGQPIQIAHPAPFVVSLGVALLAVITFSFLFAPLTFLVGGQSGFFNALIPIGIVLSGFVHPIGLLPPVVEVAARLLSTSWAMEAVLMSLEAGALTLRIAVVWGISLILSGMIFLLACFLFTAAEKRVRRSGNLSIL